MSTLVIGYGNTLRSDDGLGPFVAGEIANGAWPDVRVLTCHQLTPELAEILAAATRIIFVDASCDPQAEPVEVQRLTPADTHGAASHGSDPPGLLALARDLFGHAPEAWLVSIRGEKFDLGEYISTVGQRNAQQALARIKNLLSRPVAG